MQDPGHLSQAVALDNLGAMLGWVRDSLKALYLLVRFIESFTYSETGKNVYVFNGE